MILYLYSRLIAKGGCFGYAYHTFFGAMISKEDIMSRKS